MLSLTAGGTAFLRIRSGSDVTSVCTAARSSVFLD